MVRLLTDPASALLCAYPMHEERFALTARHLTIGGLYWVAPDMVALAASAGRSLDTVSLDMHTRPSAAGLMVMDGGVGLTHYDREQRIDIPIDAISWGPHPRGLEVTFWGARSRIDDQVGPRGMSLDHEAIPALFPIGGNEFEIHETPVEDMVAETGSAMCTLVAAWHLMQQPTLADRYPAERDKKAARSYARAGRGEPDVTIIDLRRRYRPGDDQPTEEQPGRYSHRWVVSGHWRQQPYGPGRELRQRIWIADYVKGPDGAPLMVRERVNVWRR